LGDESCLEKTSDKVPFGKLTAFRLSKESGVMTGSVIDMDQNVIGAND